MTWQDDLGGLIQEMGIAPAAIGGAAEQAAGTAAGNFFSSPVGTPIAEKLASPLAQTLFGAMSIPLTYGVKYPIGTAWAGINEALGALPGQPGYDPAMSQAFHHAPGQGPMGVIPGGPLATWEARRAQEPRWFQAPTELALDPTFYLGDALPFGALRNAGRVGERSAMALEAGARGADIAGRPILAASLRGGAKGAEAAQYLWNDMPGDVLGRAAQTRPGQIVTGLPRAAIQKAFPTAFDFAPQTQIEQRMAAAGNARMAERSASGTFQSLIAPMTRESGPPIVPHPHPVGSAPDQIYKKGIAGWFQSWVGNRAAPGRLGIISRSSVFGKAAEIPPFTEHDLNAMVDVGNSLMQSINDDTQLLGGIRRMTVQAPQWRQALTQQYGDQVIPYLPHIWERTREKYPQLQLPSVRHALPYATAAHEPALTRLDKIQADLTAGKITREEALSRVANFPMGSPQAVEAAASQGASFLSAFHQGYDPALFRPGGDLFPTAGQVTPEMGGNAYRAAAPEPFAQGVWSGGGPVPHDLTSPGAQGLEHGAASLVPGQTAPFGTNRAAWDAYMQELYGPMQQDELNTLAQMSVDQLYHAYVNAANDTAQGAANFAKDTLSKSFRRRKVGLYATEETQRGSATGRALTVDNPNITSLRAGGKVSDKAAWAEQFRQIQGHAPTREEINGILGTPDNVNPIIDREELKRAVAALGGTPLQKSPTGGMLPNLKGLLNAYEFGKDLPLHAALGSPAHQYYDRAAQEISMIVGVGNPDQARMFMHIMALTSSATGVERNVSNALRALAEWEYGYDKTLVDKFQITGPKLDEIIRSGALHANLGETQGAGIDALFREAQRIRGVPTGLPGAKEHQYAGSFMAPFFRSQLDHVASVIPASVRGQAKEAFDRAMTVFAGDRHISRVENGATAVSELQQHMIHERAALAAQAAGVQTEQLHGGLWYFSREHQGFARLHYPESDVAQAVRSAVQELWNTSGQPGPSWHELVATVAAKHPDMGEQELYQEVYDLARQDIFYRALESSFRKPEVQKALRAKGLPTSVSELSHDIVGIVSRGAHGLYPDEWPQPLGAQNVADLSQQLEDVAGSRQPAMLTFVGGKWQPVPGGSYAVPLMDAGTFSAGQTQTARKALERLIQKPIVSDIFDPLSGDRSGQLGIGIAPVGGRNTGRYRLQLHALTSDQATAEAGAARAGAKHIIDPNGYLIPTRVSGPRQASLPTLLQEMFGPAQQFPRPSASEAMRRGVTLGESDSANPVSLLYRKVINPVMDAYNALSDTHGIPAVAAKMDTLGIPAWEGDSGGLTRRGYNTAISANDNAALLAETRDGTTYRAIIEQYAKEGEQAQAAFRDAGVTWKPFSSLEERKAAVNHDPELVKLIDKWHARGIDPLWADHPDDIGLGMLEHQLHKDAGIKATRSTVPGLLKAAWSEQVLATPKNATGNIFTNWLMAAVAGHNVSLTPADYMAAFKVEHGGLDAITRDEVLNSLKGTETMHEFGLEGLPNEVMRGQWHEVRSNTQRYSRSAIGELTGRMTKSPRLAKAVGAPFILVRDFNQAADTVARSSILGDVMKRRMYEMLPSWDAEVRQAGAGIPGFEWDSVQKINTPSGGLYTDALTAKLGELGINDQDAAKLVRDYANLRGKALSDAKEAMNHVLFSYEKTNLDVKAGAIIPFHYWYSRALRFWSEEAVRNPWLIVNYMRMNQGIEDAQNDPGLSARQKGFIGLFGTPIGFTLLMQPDALFGVTKVFNMDGSYESDGQTSLGKAINWMKDHGLGMYPWIDGTLNMMGMYGNTFEPDLLGIRDKALVGASINFARAHLGFDPAGAPYADAMGSLRYSVSSFVDSFTPDWLTQTVTPRAGGSSQEASLNTIIESVIMANNPSMTNQQLIDIMADPESPEYTDAYRQAADAGIVQQLLNISAPVSFRMRNDARDVRLAQMNTIFEAATKVGLTPYQFLPTTADVAFMAKYKALTGNDWKPGDYQNAKLKNDLANAPTAQKQFILDDATWNNLGTPAQQKAYSTYYALLYGSDPRTASIVDPGARREIANTWADRHAKVGRQVDEMQAIRDTFTSTHMDFAAYKDWSKRVSSLAGMYGGSLAEYRRRTSLANPNAARYFAQQEAYMRSTVPPDQWEAARDKFTTSASAYLAITGQGSASATSPGGMTNRQEQGPYPGVTPADVTLPNMLPAPQAPSAGAYPEDWARQAASINVRPIGYS